MKPSQMKHLPTGWAEEADAMTVEQLRACIVDSSANLAEIDRSALDDEKLQELKQAAKEAGAGYADARKCQRAKVAYCLEALAQKGQPAGSEIEEEH